MNESLKHSSTNKWLHEWMVNSRQNIRGRLRWWEASSQRVWRLWLRSNNICLQPTWRGRGPGGVSSVQLASKKFKFYQELYTEIRIKAVPTRLACHATKESHCAVLCTVFPNLSWSFCRVSLHLVCTCSCLFTALRLTAELRSHTPGRSSAMELEVGSWQKPPKMPMIGFYPYVRHCICKPSPSLLLFPLPQ